MSINTKMTALADEIRELSGTTAAMGLDAMVINVGDANIEVEDQTDIIAQIKNILKYKSCTGIVINDTSSAYVDGERLVI